jgi:hypothetical protein
MEKIMSEIAPPNQQEALLAAAQVYVSTLMGQASTIYQGPTGFDTWPEEAKHACLISIGLQGLLAPEAFAAERLSLDHAAYAVGIALGSMTGNVPAEAVNAYLKHMGRGFAVGRREAFVAQDGFKTVGSPQ